MRSTRIALLAVTSLIAFAPPAAAKTKKAPAPAATPIPLTSYPPEVEVYVPEPPPAKAAPAAPKAEIEKPKRKKKADAAKTESTAIPKVETGATPKAEEPLAPEAKDNAKVKVKDVAKVRDVAKAQRANAAEVKTQAEVKTKAVVSKVAEVAAAGCRTPPPGKLPPAVKVKEKGRFSIDEAPHISKISATEVCANSAKMRAGSVPGTAGSALGLSSQVLNTRAGRMDLVALPGMERELQKLLVRFGQAWPYAPLAQTPRILFRASDSYDAYALPDNTIVVSLGMIQAAETDSEVMFVLAHEYSHLLMGHHLKSQSVSGAQQLIKVASTAYQSGVFVSQVGQNMARGNLSLTPADQGKVKAAATKATVVSEVLRFAVDDIFEPAWNRDQENEADALAIDLLIGSNMTIDSYDKVFDRLQKAFESQQKSRAKGAEIASNLSKNLADSMKELTSDKFLTKLTTGGGTSAGALKSMGGSIATKIGGSILSGLGSLFQGDSHLPPEDRRQGLAAYFEAGYPEADPPIDTGAVIRTLKAMPEYRSAIATKDGYIAARTLYFGQDFNGASAALRKLGAGTRTAPTFINYMAAITARDSGNHAMARSYFDAGRTGSGVPNAQLYEQYAEMGIADRDTQGATSVIADAESRFNDPDHFKSIEIRRDLSMGDTLGAQSVYAACMKVKGRDYIPERCKAVMPEDMTKSGNPLKIKLPFMN